jgi:asparagine synthase (glutamine-hydrolysing)
MCGICGIISKSAVDEGIVKKMNNALIHRGPDCEGYYSHEGISIGMRRLAIIDLATGWQPLYNEDRSLVLILNGEIYNYIELRKLLTNKGHKFTTSGDAETILHLYEEYGKDCVNYLRGMFAFALWDTKKKELFIARDRMGEKPLYFYQNSTSLLFSSELRSLLSSEQINKELNPFSIDLFFHYQYIPEPHTIIKEVKKLEAGHYMIIDQETMKIQDHCYWNMEDSPVIKGDPVKLIRESLEETIQLVLRADVPIGIALSGGIDSSIIAAYASKYYSGKLTAFTVGYEGRPESDERSAAKKIAEHLDLPFHEIELNNNDFVSNFPKMCTLTDDPIGDISAFGYYSVSKAAKERNIPVLLQGQGGDEFFWGYKWVQDDYQYVQLKNGLLNNTSSFIDYYKQKFKEKYTAPNIKKYIKGILSINEAKNLYMQHKNEDKNIFPFYDYLPNFSSDYTSNYGELLQKNTASLDKYYPFRVEHPWDNPDVILTRLISQTYLLENGMAQGDRLSMANSVELRLPLVDYKLVETVIGLRKNKSDVQLPQKTYLKEIGKEMLPSWLFEGRKRGFEPPSKLWVNSVLNEYQNRMIDGHLINEGILNTKTIDGFLKPEVKSNELFQYNSLVLELYLDSILN